MAPKCFLMVLAMLLTIARADTNQESIFSKVKEISTVITNEVNYMPPMLILGKSDGSIVRCPHATPTSCEVYHSPEWTAVQSAECPRPAVTATVVHGEFLFAALKSGVMLRCSWQRTHSCSVFNHADSEMTGLAVAAGFIHAGLQNGTVLRCSMNTPHSCRIFANLGWRLTSLAASGSFIYAGSGSVRIDRCDISGNCSPFCAFLHPFPVTGLAVFGDKVYGTTYRGILLIGHGTSNVCESRSIAGDRYGNMAVYNGKLYLVRLDVNEIRAVQVPTIPYGHGQLSSNFAAHKGAVSISFAHGTYAMQDKYRMESTKCTLKTNKNEYTLYGNSISVPIFYTLEFIWKGVFTCLPTVVYYTDFQHRATLEVFVKDGKLIDSQGHLVDTSEADESRSQRAAIFVMGPDGQILLSNVHKTGLLHTSSLLAGNPVSGAGLIVVVGGKIRSINACSAHYRPDQSLNEQVRESLRMKGYTDTIDFHPCICNDTFCVQDGTNGTKFR